MPAERRATFRARSLICFRTSSAPLSPSRERKEMTIVLPPVEPDLLRPGDGAKDHPNAHCEELDLGDRDANVAGDGKALVEHAVENVDDAAGYYALHFCLRILIPLSNSSEGETGGSVQRWCLIQYAQISAP